MNFYYGALFTLLPAALIFPALRLLVICPPSYGAFLAIAVIVIFVAAESYGLVRIFKCLIGKWDLTAIGSILCAAVGLSMLLLLFGIWILSGTAS